MTSVSVNASQQLMKVVAARASKKTFPTGDPNFAVMQCFPAAFPPEESDPFLMCDVFGPTISDGKVEDPDEFPVQWHPHRGMDIMTYMTEGVGRHADSLGSRSEFKSPGFQWCSVGSGIEHAEGGGTPAGESMKGFQIWINVPAKDKMNDPAYGIEPPENIPTFKPADGVLYRVLAGQLGDARGPFKTVAAVQMVDYELAPGAATTHTVMPNHLDNCLILCHKGSGTVNGREIHDQQCVRLDATDPNGPRSVELVAGSAGGYFLCFAGQRIKEKVAWRGPIVMNTDNELQTAFRELHSGTFLKKRAPWNYRRFASAPKIEKTKS